MQIFKNPKREDCSKAHHAQIFLLSNDEIKTFQKLGIGTAIVPFLDTMKVWKL
jgi:hypothetical protein